MKWKAEYDKLAVYNSEVSRGLTHTDEYKTKMKLVQDEYDNIRLIQKLDKVSKILSVPSMFGYQTKKGVLMIVDFVIYAEKKSINLEDEEDWKPWYDCWADGYNASLKAYATWKDGKQLIGALQRPIKDCLLKAD